MLPVSQYEALLAEVRGLRRKAQRVQQLATPLISSCSSGGATSSPHLFSHAQIQNDDVKLNSFMMEPLLTRQQTNFNVNCEGAMGSNIEDDEFRLSPHNMSVSTSEPPPNHLHVSSLYHGTWPTTATETMWNSEPIPSSDSALLHHHHHHQADVTSVMSFASSSGGVALDRVLAGSPSSRRSSQQLEAKVDMVYSLLAMLSGQEHADMGETLLALSTSPESCLAMRQSGCIPLLVQMVQSDREAETRRKAAMALHNLVHSQPDEKLRKREIRIFKLLEQARAYTEALRSGREDEFEVTASASEGGDKHPVQNVAHLMKLSFDELHRQAICQLGGIHIIAGLVEAEHANHGSTTDEAPCILMRRYACMALTNLTFGDSGNKALLCSLREFMRSLVVQLQSPSDELRQVTASVLRNLSWRADSSSKEILREVGSVTGLMKASMLDNSENTLKSILSALWNLSAHCTENKSEICSVDGALGFLVDMLLPSKSTAIVENSGGILRNISSQIAVRDDYREILRQHECLQILLDQLKSPSLTIVSNACGTLWNLSAKCAADQEALWQMGAPAMLRSLNHSKHKMIAMGSSAALKNLLSAKPTQSVLPPLDSTALAMDLPVLPTLGARKQRALLQDLDQTLSETYENIEKDASPVKNNSFFEGTSGSSGKQQKSKLKQQHNDDVFADEKDRCSIEDVSDSENIGAELDSGYLTSGLVARREVVESLTISSTSLVVNTHKIPGNFLQNTVFEDDEVNLTAKCFSGDLEDVTEKRDTENEKSFSEDFVGEFTDFIGVDNKSSSSDNSAEDASKKHQQPIQALRKSNLGRSLPRFSKNNSTTTCSSPEIAIEASNSNSSALGKELTCCTSNKGANKVVVVASSGLPRRVFSTSTPIRSCETSKVQNIDTNKKCDRLEPPWVDETAVCSASSVLTTMQEADDLPSLENLNISLENNVSQSEDSFIVEEVEKHEESSRQSSTKEQETKVPEKAEKEEEEDEDCQIDNRMLDPDAMIESLERFTAELVSQASHLQSGGGGGGDNNNESSTKYKDTNNTWNEDTSPNDVTFPSFSGTPPSVLTFESESISCNNISENASSNQPNLLPAAGELISNDFSASTMTQSTLIAMEATRMAEVFKCEAEMSSSSSSLLQLDDVPQPVLVESTGSPKLISRKRSLPRSLMVRRALLTNTTNLESLENHSWTNLDSLNPPSVLGDVFDLDASLTSVASLPHENQLDFVINGIVGKEHIMGDSSSCTQIENMAPPSLFDDITDMCNSLADVGTETELFEDCQTHVFAPTDDDDFSDANSATPIPSDFGSSSENTPKKKSISKVMMTSKQRRNLARDRYRTYTVAAEMVMKEEESIQNSNSNSNSEEDQFKTDCCMSDEYKSIVDDTNSETTYVSPTFSVKPSAKEKRQMDRARYETQTIPEPVVIVKNTEGSSSSGCSSSKRGSKLSIRRSFMQKRLENKERFKTQTLNESLLPPGVVSPQICNDEEVQLHLLVQKEANLVLKSLKESKVDSDSGLLDCETLSLVSNDEDSEQNSGASGNFNNYRTYHKNWGLKKNNIPVIKSEVVGSASTSRQNDEVEVEETKVNAKPKIVKPRDEEEVAEEQEEDVPKGIRGRRKALYSKKTIFNNTNNNNNNNRVVQQKQEKNSKPIKSMTSNLVKNVSSSFKSASKGSSRASSGYGTKQNSPKTSPARKVTSSTTALKPPQASGKVVERQGTFTKDETKRTVSRLPTKTGSFSKISMLPTRSAKSASAERVPSSSASSSSSKISRIQYGRSTSADSRDNSSSSCSVARKMQNSASSQSLKGKKVVGSSAKSGSNSSLNGGGGGGSGSGTGAKKQVTSKIASLWKKIEESKNKQQMPMKKDTRVWIESKQDEVEVVVDAEEVVVLREKSVGNVAGEKRVSRLGSFIVMDEAEGKEVTSTSPAGVNY